MVADLRSDLSWQGGIVVIALLLSGWAFTRYREQEEKAADGAPGKPPAVVAGDGSAAAATVTPAPAPAAAAAAAPGVKATTIAEKGGKQPVTADTEAEERRSNSGPNSREPLSPCSTNGGGADGGFTARSTDRLTAATTTTTTTTTAKGTSGAGVPPSPSSQAGGGEGRQTRAASATAGGRDRGNSLAAPGDPWRMLECASRAILAGLFSGSTGMCSKLVIVTVVAAVSAGDYKAVLARWEWYLALAGLPASLVLQLRFLNSALKRFDALEAVPIYQSAVSLIGMAWGWVFFNEAAGVKPSSLVMFAIGCSISCAGVCVLMAKRRILRCSRRAQRAWKRWRRGGAATSRRGGPAAGTAGTAATGTGTGAAAGGSTGSTGSSAAATRDPHVMPPITAVPSDDGEGDSRSPTAPGVAAAAAARASTTGLSGAVGGDSRLRTEESLYLELASVPHHTAVVVDDIAVDAGEAGARNSRQQVQQQVQQQKGAQAEIEGEGAVAVHDTDIDTDTDSDDAEEEEGGDSSQHKHGSRGTLHRPCVTASDEHVAKDGPLSSGSSGSSGSDVSPRQAGSRSRAATATGARRPSSGASDHIVDHSFYLSRELAAVAADVADRTGLLAATTAVTTAVTSAVSNTASRLRGASFSRSRSQTQGLGSSSGCTVEPNNPLAVHTGDVGGGGGAGVVATRSPTKAGASAGADSSWQSRMRASSQARASSVADDGRA